MAMAMHHAATPSMTSCMSPRAQFATSEACIGSPVALSLSSAAGNLHFFMRSSSSSSSSSGGSTSGSSSRQQARSSTRCQCNPDSVDNIGEEALLNMKSVSARKFEEHLSTQTEGESEQESDWDSWQKYFSKVDEEANLIQALKFQIEDAVKSEDYPEAAKLKAALEAATSNDVLSEISKELKRALQEERYSDAARLRDEAGSGLVGWWAGKAKDGSDPFGWIINIKASHGRLVAEGYNARQLATSTSGSPLFEVYIKKCGDTRFSSQAVYLHKKATKPEALSDVNIDDIVEQVVKASAKATEELNPDVENLSEGKTIHDVKEAETKSKEIPPTDETKPEANAGNSSPLKEDKSATGKDKAKKGINDIVNFLKDRIPELGMKVIRVVAPEGSEPEAPKVVEEVLEKEEKDQEESSVVIEGSSEKPEKQPESESPVAVRVVIGGASPGNEDDANAPVVKLPATIDQKSKDSFEFHFKSVPSADEVSRKDIAPSWKVAKVATIAAADQMPKDVAKLLWNAEKVPPVKSSKEAKGLLKLRLRQALGANKLSQRTAFHRIDVSQSTDPITGVYIGTFGANVPEVLQINRKYGNWDSQNTANLKFYEYVEAVKLTGDVNVPAGQVSFRAKVGRDSRLSPYGVYPEELGVIARYKGEGQLADQGFKNPRWTEGELVLLDGKRLGPTNGATLGFVFCLPDHHFLILFDKLNLVL